MQVKLSGHAMLPVGVEDRVIVVRDEEPTSLVAYALASRRETPTASSWALQGCMIKNLASVDRVGDCF